MQCIPYSYALAESLVIARGVAAWGMGPAMTAWPWLGVDDVRAIPGSWGRLDWRVGFTRLSLWQLSALSFFGLEQTE